MEKVEEIVKVGKLKCVIRNHENELKTNEGLKKQLDSMKITEKNEPIDEELSLERILKDERKDVNM